MIWCGYLNAGKDSRGRNINTEDYPQEIKTHISMSKKTGSSPVLIIRKCNIRTNQEIVRASTRKRCYIQSPLKSTTIFLSRSVLLNDGFLKFSHFAPLCLSTRQPKSLEKDIASPSIKRENFSKELTVIQERKRSPNRAQ